MRHSSYSMFVLPTKQLNWWGGERGVTAHVHEAEGLLLHLNALMKWDNASENKIIKEKSLYLNHIQTRKSQPSADIGARLPPSLPWPQGAKRPHIPSRVLSQQVMPWARASPTPPRPSVQSIAPPITFPLPWNPPKHIPYKSSFPTKIPCLTLTLQSALTP